MFSIGHILREATDEYLTYLSKKTGFILRGDALTGAKALHDYLRSQLKSFDMKSLTTNQVAALDKLFLNFGNLGELQCNAADYSLESSVSWIMISRDGGLMIPAEMIKGFMVADARLPQRYLFHIIYRLKGRELSDYAALLQKKAVQLALPQEDPLDLALAIYLYLTEAYNGSKDLPFRLTPGSSSRKSQTATGVQPLWRFLEEGYPNEKQDIEKVKMHMSHSGKGFYRSLELALDEKAPISQLFMNGLLFPIPTGINYETYRIVTPPEVIELGLNQRIMH
jgi:hypothetical protein